MKNEISIRGEFEEYEDDLGALDPRDVVADVAEPRINDGRPRDGMRLLQTYFSGPDAHRRVMLFENFVSLLGGQADDGGYGEMYRNKLERDYRDGNVYRGASDRGDYMDSNIGSIMGSNMDSNRMTYDRRTVG